MKEQLFTPLSRALLGVFCLGLVMSLPAAPAYAQRGDDDRRSERDRDDRDRRDSDRGRDRGRDRDRDDDRRRGDDGDDRSRDERRMWYLRRMDRNGDGKIERSEVDSDRWWGFFERQAKEAGLDPSSAITIDQYMTARRKQDRAERRSENPTAFLPPIETKPAPGFDTPLEENELILLNPDRPRPPEVATEPAAEGSARSDRSSSNESRDDRTERYARSLMERYDKNKNSILERDEWKEMRGDPEKSDLNGDGRITRDELVKRFSSYQRNDKSDSSDDGRSDRGEGDDRRSRRSRDDRGREDNEQARSTYRFTTALERLPGDARSWVERYDKNQDGQVAMSEFTSSWNDSKVREFAGYDKNGDGVVTGDEYMSTKRR